MIHSKDALRHGQRPTVELVDFCNLQSTLLRNLLVRYMEERRPGVDHGTFVGLARELAVVPSESESAPARPIPGRVPARR
ncbi:hypothetical protein [Streptomyces uncialis]|uniref:hypothetical protein n=1 Tax=Streptomyces uncialis TaxID=1048205 RepID=UPI0037A3D239